MSTLFQSFSKNQQNQQNQPHKIYHLKIKSKHNSFKILKNFKIFQKKYHNPKISENQCPTIFVHDFFEIHAFFRNSWNFLKFMEFFEIQCPTIFWDFGFFKQPSPGRRGALLYDKTLPKTFLKFNVPRFFATLGY